MLSSVEAVIEGVGGVAAAAALAGVGVTAVLNWKSRTRIPADNFLTFSKALAEGGKPAPDPAVFGIKAVEEARA